MFVMAFVNERMTVVLESCELWSVCLCARSRRVSQIR